MLEKSKAETLFYLNDKIRNFVILPGVAITREQFYSYKGKKNFSKFLLNKFNSKQLLIVRSSFANEDKSKESNAGKYLTLKNIKVENIKIAIRKVFESNKFPVDSDQVLIQPQLTDVTYSGVITTFDTHTQNFYITFALDKSGDTSIITSGKKNNLITVYYKKAAIKFDDPIIRLLQIGINELEQILNSDKLDIEFAIDKNFNKPVLLQVRNIISNSTNKKNKIDNQLKIIKEKVIKLLKPNHLLFGEFNILGNMPDWNPAEIIGTRPDSLSLSLYKELITNNIWAYQRFKYGYKDMRSFPLMIDLCGQPYIDVRVSFNSFLPQNLSNSLSSSLVNSYLEKLKSNPQLHDKIEFEIVISCLTFDFNDKIQFLKLNKNNYQEFKNQLRLITNNIINPGSPIWKQELSRLANLKERYVKIVNSSLEIEAKIYWLIEDCKRFGTLPFGGLARAAFIAMQILESLVNRNIITHADKNIFLNGIETVSKKLITDVNKKDLEYLVEEYGHLRPGTYDITQKAYFEDPNLYFKVNKSFESINTDIFKLNKLQRFDIQKLIKEFELDTNGESLMNTIRELIELREYSKFLFTRNLSTSLELIKLLGQKNNIELNDLKHLDYEIFKKIYLSSENINDTFKQTIKINKEKSFTTSSIWLPPLITSENDIYSFQIPSLKPNFITQKKIEAFKSELKESNVSQTILLIENADPGFDWIFNQNISGFITAHGGKNSHMAIRAAELNMPAAIGVGEHYFKLLIKANRILLDCKNQRIEIIR